MDGEGRGRAPAFSFLEAARGADLSAARQNEDAAFGYQRCERGIRHNVRAQVNCETRDVIAAHVRLSMADWLAINCGNQNAVAIGREGQPGLNI